MGKRVILSITFLKLNIVLMKYCLLFHYQVNIQISVCVQLLVAHFLISM